MLNNLIYNVKMCFGVSDCCSVFGTSRRKQIDIPVLSEYFHYYCIFQEHPQPSHFFCYYAFFFVFAFLSRP